MPEERIARLESDVKHIDATLTDMKLDIREIRSGLESLDTRLSNRMDNLDTRLVRVEMTIKSAITSFKATVAVLTLTFGIVVYMFGSYATKILDAVNGLVLK